MAFQDDKTSEVGTHYSVLVDDSNEPSTLLQITKRWVSLRFVLTFY